MDLTDGLVINTGEFSVGLCYLKWDMQLAVTAVWQERLQ